MNWWDTATKHNSKPNLKSWVLSWLFMSHFHKWWENRFRCTCGKMQLDNRCLWQAIFLNTSVKVVSTATTLHCHRMSTLSRAATYPNPSNTQAHPGFIFLHGVNLALLSRTHGGQLKPFLGTSSRATLTRKANLIIKQVKVQSWRRHFSVQVYQTLQGSTQWCQVKVKATAGIRPAQRPEHVWCDCWLAASRMIAVEAGLDLWGTVSKSHCTNWIWG